MHLPSETVAALYEDHASPNGIRLSSTGLTKRNAATKKPKTSGSEWQGKGSGKRGESYTWVREHISLEVSLQHFVSNLHNVCMWFCHSQ